MTTATDPLPTDYEVTELDLDTPTTRIGAHEFFLLGLYG